MSDALELKVRVTCERFPEIVIASREMGAGDERSRMFLGTQRGEEIEQLVDVESVPAKFVVNFAVKKAPNRKPNFTGPYAKGTPAERFFYLVWVKVDGKGGHERCGRTKVPLTQLSWKSVEKAASAQQGIGVTLTMSDAKGRARMGSLKADEMRWDV